MESAPNKNPSDGAPSGALPTADAVRNLLRAVIDPELGDNVVDLGMVGDVGVGADDVAVVVEVGGRCSKIVEEFSRLNRLLMPGSQ